MKKIKQILAVLLAILLILALAFRCEKDDICDTGTPTTPKLVIKFYDISKPSTVKKVTNLMIKADGVATALILNTSSEATATTKYYLNDTIVKIPLQIDKDFTKYEMTFNADLTTKSTDVIQFNYVRRNEYVSRACGFRTYFDFSTLTINPYTLNGSASATVGNWIKGFQIFNTIVNNENETHIKIFI